MSENNQWKENSFRGMRGWVIISLGQGPKSNGWEA